MPCSRKASHLPPCWDPRCSPRRRCGSVAHRSRPLIRVACSATGSAPLIPPSRRAFSFLRYSVGQSMWVRCSERVFFAIRAGYRYLYIGVLFCANNKMLFVPKILEKLRKNRKKHLQNGHTSCIMIRHGNFSVVIYTTHPGTCRSSDRKIGRSE